MSEILVQPEEPRSICFADLGTRLGERFGPTPWTTVTQAQVDRFAELTYDAQWIHVDVERAKAGPFGRTIAHGYLTLSLVPLFLGQLVVVADASMAMNYGLERVRFPAPVPVGARIRATAEVIDVRAADGRAAVTMRLAVECDAAEKPVCVADVVILFIG